MTSDGIDEKWYQDYRECDVMNKTDFTNIVKSSEQYLNSKECLLNDIADIDLQ